MTRFGALSRRSSAPCAAALAVCVVALHAQVPTDPNSKADEQYRLALGLLLNTRVVLHDEAAKEFDVFLKDFPNDTRAPLARFWLGECRVRQERFGDALREFEQVATHHPQCERHAEALFRVGELNDRLARHDAAVQANARFLELYPTHTLAAAVRERDGTSRVAALRELATQDPEAALRQAQTDAARDDVAGQEALALLGTLRYQRGDFAGSAQACEDFLGRFPKAANLEEVHFNAASAYLRVPDDAKALAHLRAVRMHRPGETAHLRGVLLLRQKQDAEALTEFHHVVDKFPESPYWSQSLFELARAGDVKARERLIAKQPGSELADQVLCLWASELVEKGSPDEALKKLEAVTPASALAPQAETLRASALYQSGAAREKQGSVELARKAYEQVVALHPKDPHAPYALLRLGELLFDKDRAAAQTALARLSKDYPGFEHAAQGEALAAHGRYADAWALYEAKRFDQAAPLLAALADHPELGADAAYTAILCYRNLKLAAQQETLCRRLQKDHPDYKHRLEVRRLLGEALVEQRKWQEAATLYTAWADDLQEPAPRAEAQLNAGMALFQLNQLPRARELLTAAAEGGDPFAKARATFTLGELELGRKNLEEAKRLFLKVSILFEHPELTPASMVEAAKCLRGLNDPEVARKLLESVVKDYPNSAVAPAAKALLP